MFTKVEEINTIVDKTRSYFEKGATKKITWRRKQWLGLSHFVKTEETKIKDCLRKDLKQTEILVQAGEIAIIQNSVNLALKKLDDWCYPKIVNDLPLSVFPSKAFIVREPLGVCAILGVWNFPFLTVLEPLVAAIAAGTSVVLKPSEISSHSCNLIFEKLPLYVDSQAISIITGGPEQAVELLKHRFDHIFYTVFKSLCFAIFYFLFSDFSYYICIFFKS
ncbi:hypothetical protein MHBO_002496 [Bonamia ostreae]|uniref:Aldehyde dehydrogenase domain-containing protein n=1 Tax=Bonamia ostreae TaxID=126728 RepID=A0ABV2AMI4_9EUKA